MPRTASQYKEMKDERIASIFEASIPLFIEFGKKKTTVDKICARAKCSHGLVYHYFKDTDDIYNAITKLDIYKKIHDDLFSNIKNRLSIDILNHFSEVLLNATKDKKESLIAHFLIDEEGKNCFFDILAKTIKQGQKEGDILAGNEKELAHLYIYFFKGIYYKNTNTKGEIEIPSLDVVSYLYKKNRY